MERPLPVTQWFRAIERSETHLVRAIYEKILSDLKRDWASLGEPPNYFSFSAVEGDGKFFTSHISCSIAPKPWDSLAMFVSIKRTEDNGFDTYHPRGFRQELNGIETEIHFQLPKERPFVSDNEALLDWANWFLEAEERTVVVRGKFNIASGRAINQKLIGEQLSSEQLYSLKEFMEGYLTAKKGNPVLVVNVRSDLLSENSPEIQELLVSNDTLIDLYALAIGA